MKYYFVECKLDIFDENLVLVYRFYVENCISEHMTDKIFSGDRPSENPAPCLARWGNRTAPVYRTTFAVHATRLKTLSYNNERHKIFSK